MSSYAVNSPATADSANTVATAIVTDVMIVDIPKADATQIEVHHSQVKRYPTFEVSGGNFFQIQFLGVLKIVSLVISRVTR